MSSLFGLELPTPVNFVIAFVFVLLLIGAAAWLVRRFGVTHAESPSRGRQPRLAVIDFASVDGRRKLIIIRRDNVEHLLMIGGPSDVVVETNIVRNAAAATTRDLPPAPPSRTLPLPDPTPWPVQPELPSPAMPAIPPAATARTARSPSDDAWQPPVEAAVPAAPPVQPAPEVRATMRPPETLVGLAEDLARPTEPVAIRPVQVQPQRIAAAAPAGGPPAADHSLAEMAQRLEAALRRPMAQKLVAETPRVTATLDVKAAPVKAAAAQERASAQPSKPQNNLEQEMASLLSKPGKT